MKYLIGRFSADDIRLQNGERCDGSASRWNDEGGRRGTQQNRQSTCNRYVLNQWKYHKWPLKLMCVVFSFC